MSDKSKEIKSECAIELSKEEIDYLNEKHFKNLKTTFMKIEDVTFSPIKEANVEGIIFNGVIFYPDVDEIRKKVSDIREWCEWVSKSQMIFHSKDYADGRSDAAKEILTSFFKENDNE